MLKNHIKLAWRNLIKNKKYTLINLAGLSIGMTCYILIALFIQYEVSFDRHHQKADRIYRVAQRQIGNEYRGTNEFALAPLPLSKALVNDYPEVEAVANLNQDFTLLINGNESYPEQGLSTDSSFFEVFSVPLLQGNIKEIFEDINTIVLTESLSKKLFGSDSPIGKSIFYARDRKITVAGIIPDPPVYQHLQYSYLVSYKIRGYYPNDIDNWVSNNYHAYLALYKDSDFKALEEKMQRYNAVAKPAYEELGFNFYPEYFLQPLKDIHLKSNINMEIGRSGDIRYLYLFGSIALIILVLASINYINLATAKSAKRAKEVGVSKVLGAKKGNLIMQFLSESFLLSLCGGAIASILAFLFLPSFNGLLDQAIPFDFVGSWWILPLMILIALLIGVLSGLYPAFFLSSLSPVRALKGNFIRNHKEGNFLRNTLVVGQFVVAIALAIGSIIIHQQLSYIQNKKLGYSKEQVVHVPYFESEIAEKEDVLKNELLNHPNINKVSISTQLPMNITSQGIVNEWDGNSGEDEMYIYRCYVDHNFIDLFEMEILEGRAFSKEFPTDSSATYILNEAAFKKTGWTSAVGKKFRDGTVIGVVKNFHLQTFDLTIEPLFMAMRNIPQLRNFGHIILKVDTEDFANTKNFIEETMKSIVPMVNYEARFMEDSYAQMYDKENRLGNVFSIFTMLALFIAAMGLFGLVSYNVVQRTKEIGIRKVLGSSIIGIMNLVAKDFLKLVLVAIIIAVPIAFYAMNNWLQDYAYRTEIKWWVFLLVGLGTIGISFITICFQSFKAASVNPIKSLRTE
ncbi:ABC transporter permease [Croceivirga thetidis]|uniref:FtsX-like permease family protein n=1 Tax=Croceivirga thetidis TaxID=2721623 RepID=A0ABX1GN59_9FLAO|nr:FtsX-like permease family protein [Croceivirga thetidis]NKI31314.1 FtsX-like permease family protein [Croceivirga thetidis]